MTTPTDLYNSENPDELLGEIINSDMAKKFGQDRIGTETEISNALAKINDSIGNSNTNLTLLLRGINKSKLKTNLIDKLNSNDSLYDGLFLVGDKAKKFLEKNHEIPHPIKNIHSASDDTASWIFDLYGKLLVAPIDLTYFKNQNNKTAFIKATSKNQNLIDYYLFGLHTNNSDTMVNFVSTTSSPKVALHNQTIGKLIIFLWLPQNYNLYINVDKLRIYKEKVAQLRLPILNDSFFSDEREVSFKGCILPHFILAIHDLEEGALILNPALIEDKANWIDDGMNVNQENFSAFIKTTKYKRFLLLTSDHRLEEKNVG
ncbi:MAG TPA: hypothetical protein VIL78_20255 [Hanamia sp.]